MSKTKKDQPAWTRTIPVAERGIPRHHCQSASAKRRYGADACDIDAVPSPTAQTRCYRMMNTYPYYAGYHHGPSKVIRKAFYWAPARRVERDALTHARKQNRRDEPLDDRREPARDHRHSLQGW